MQNEYVIIVAGGTGTRMNKEIPKQFIKLGGVPIIVIAIQKFINYNANIQIVIAVHANYQKYLNTLLKKHLPKYLITVVKGGNTRFESVKNALACVPNKKGIVGIHDAARPFVSVQVIKNCYEVAHKKGNAIPSVGLHESIRLKKESSNKAVDRKKYHIIQTPQCFQIKQIKKAFLTKYSEKFTDDATVFESTGKQICLVPGNFENIKITNPNDLIIAKAYFKNAK